MFQQKKPYSAVTVTIENLTSEQYEVEDFSGIPELVEAIKLQATGPLEAARAIRKKLKYGSVHRQLRALVILDGLIQNADTRFQRAFADEPLLERLRVCGTSDLSDPAVRNKCRELFRGWSQYSKTPGLQKLAQLHKELPKRKAPVTQARSKVIQETENPFGDDDDDDEEKDETRRQAAISSSGGPSSRHALGTAMVSQEQPRVPSATGSGSFFGSSAWDKDKRKDKPKGKLKRKLFNLEVEKPQMKASIDDATIASTNLINAMHSTNREMQRISDSPQAVALFEECKKLRRKILRYIHHVDQEQYLGSLLNANDALVHALMTFEQLDRSIDADSDSDDEIAEQAHIYRMATTKPDAADTSPSSSHSPATLDLSGLTVSRKPALPNPLPPPPRPVPAARLVMPSDSQSEEDDDDPFGDKNVVETPAFETGEPRWQN